MTDSLERRKQKEYSEERETAICSPEVGRSRKQNISFEKEEWKGSLVPGADRGSEGRAEGSAGEG